MNPVQNKDWRADRASHATPPMQHYPGTPLEHGSYAPSALGPPPSLSSISHTASSHPPTLHSTHFMPPSKSEADPRLPGMTYSQPSNPRSVPLSHSASAKSPYELPIMHSGQPGQPSSEIRKRTRHDALFAPDAGLFFLDTESFDNLYALDRTTQLTIRLQAKFDRGFFLADNEWTCYRRNYFQVSGAFVIPGLPQYYPNHASPCLLREHDQFHSVQGFLLGISARIINNEKTIQLIQHTPKRDKGPQCTPEPKPIAPGGNLSVVGIGSNPNVVTFERIQFKSATANNGKRRAAQQYFVCIVDLYAQIEDGRQIKVASCRSAPLVVRGRSPGHYSDNQDRYDTAHANTTSPTSAQHDDRYAPGPPAFSRPPLHSSAVLSQDYSPYSYYSPYGLSQSQPQHQPQHHQHNLPPSSHSSSHPYLTSSMSDPSSSETSSPDMYTGEINNGLVHPSHAGDELKMHNVGIHLEQPGVNWSRSRFHTNSSHDTAYYSSSPTVPATSSAYDPRKYSVPNLVNQ